MIYKLRRRHRNMWMILAVLLPIGFVSAYLAIPEFIHENEFEAWKSVAYSTIINSAETDNLLVNLRKDENLPGQQIEVLIKQPLSSPGILVYLAEQPTENIRQANLLGSLEANGAQRFTLNDFLANFKAFHLLFYDNLKKELVEKVSLEIK